jgi:hypothetical protein
MKHVLVLGIAALFTLSAFVGTAQTATTEAAGVATEAPDPLGPFDAASVSLGDFMWVARPVVVFADSPNDPAFIRQMQLLDARRADLSERDVVILTDTDPAALSEVRTKLRPRGFMLVLIGKDGQIKLRKPSPWDVRELTRVIDKMPLRQQELRDRRALP